MVERRKPLVLSSTKILINSVLSSSRRVTGENLVGDDVSPSLQLPAGILWFSKDKIDISDAKFASLDDSALLGLSTCVLKRLSVTSGSLVSFFFSFFNVVMMLLLSIQQMSLFQY